MTKKGGDNYISMRITTVDFLKQITYTTIKVEIIITNMATRPIRKGNLVVLKSAGRKYKKADLFEVLNVKEDHVYRYVADVVQFTRENPNEQQFPINQLRRVL